MSEIDLSKIDDFAPDKATLERAYALAKPKKWQHLGSNSSYCWGVFPTRGALSYRTTANLNGKPHYCNCAASAYPCKHILALLLLLRNTPESLSKSDPPEWLASWKRRAEHDPGEEEKLAAEQKRLEQLAKAKDERLVAMQTGAGDFLRWASDLLSQGLATASIQPSSFWEEMAARMVDAKMGALARRIREWPQLLTAPDGHEELLRAISSEYLLAKAMLRLEELPDELQQNVLTRAGITRKKEQIRARPPLHDHWLVAGMERGENNSLFFRRTWLLGSGSGKAVLFLDFAHGEPDFQETWKIGMAIEGDVHFFPGRETARGLLHNYQLSDKPFTMPAGSADIQTMIDKYATSLAKNPWLERMPVFLRELKVFRRQGQWWCSDKKNAIIPLLAIDKAGWELLALGAQQPVDVFGLWNGKAFFAQSVASGARLIALSQEEQ